MNRDFQPRGPPGPGLGRHRACAAWRPAPPGKSRQRRWLRGAGLVAAGWAAIAAAALGGCAAGTAFDGAAYLAKLRQDSQEPAGTAGSGAAYELALSARDAAARVNTYAARFQKQERVGGELRPLEEIDLAVREDPFSVRMAWVGKVNRGRAALYVEGENDDRVRVRMGRLPLSPVLDLDPEGSLALSDSRYPVTDAGLRTMAGKLLKDSGQAAPAPAAAFRELGRIELDGRPLAVIGRTAAPVAGSARPGWLLSGIDLKTHLPVLMARYDADGSLLGYYCYRRLDLAAKLTDADFDFARFGK